MDGAKAPHLYRVLGAELTNLGPEAPRSRKVEGVAQKLLGVILSGAAPCADLGGSSKYSREALEDRSGEGFRVNSCWTRVSRS